MAAGSFSTLGVPMMHPFPPGVIWRNTREMLECALFDLRLPWVQNYILRSEFKDDVRALTSGENYKRAISMMYSGTAIPELSGGFQSTLIYARINVPAYCVGNVGVGIGIYKFDIEDSGNTFINNGYQFARFVSNNTKNSQLSIIRQESTGKIECLFQYYLRNRSWQYVKLVFGEELFMNSFDPRTYKVDFEQLNKGLLQSVTGNCEHQYKPRLVPNKLFPNSIADNSGQHLMKNVFCSYANSEPMLSFPVYTDAIWSFNYDAGALRSMRNWGITDRLQRFTIERVSEPFPNYTALVQNENNNPHKKQSTTNPFLIDSGIATCDDFLDCTASVENSVEGQAESCRPFHNPNTSTSTSPVNTASPPPSIYHVQFRPLSNVNKFVNIAPGPGPRRPLTEEEERERIRLERREQRKIKKRLSAARANLRRKNRKCEGAT